MTTTVFLEPRSFCVRAEMITVYPTCIFALHKPVNDFISFKTRKTHAYFEKSAKRASKRVSTRSRRVGSFSEKEMHLQIDVLLLGLGRDLLTALGFFHAHVNVRDFHRRWRCWFHRIVVFSELEADRGTDFLARMLERV